MSQNSWGIVANFYSIFSRFQEIAAVRNIKLIWKHQNTILKKKEKKEVSALTFKNLTDFSEFSWRHHSKHLYYTHTTEEQTHADAKPLKFHGGQMTWGYGMQC